jgi:hypothetical protein
MMMVSALGTVAIANFQNNDSSLDQMNSLQTKKLSKISNEQIKIIQQKEQYMQNIKCKRSKSDNYWNIGALLFKAAGNMRKNINEYQSNRDIHDIID